ncbi:MAG: Ditrans,polycis-undecaprenyl-diphosphate synthase ((2E,6E)-farnesyl-diphosphate specific) [Anaerolineae bacterium]|nr:Ditrans,polycis-undecaprenyl-diphosphate synthase ((2E,6E)-farnesyl-diphosphate specific) [Anaerolineae bacterium]
MAATVEPANETLELTHIPAHIAIIMDGNGRWAQARGMPRLMGHRAGVENIRRILNAAVEFGIQYLTIYAFSTENWNRPLDEVRGLMTILEQTIQRETPELHKNGVRIRHVGRLTGLSPKLQKMIRSAVAQTANNTRLTLNVAFNYGGRAEIIDAVKKIIADDIPADQITEELFARYLYTDGTPDPDLVVRTAGEMRLSNYLIWQAAYAEYYATPIYWPDFGKPELYDALRVYSSRERRFGKVLKP